MRMMSHASVEPSAFACVAVGSIAFTCTDGYQRARFQGYACVRGIGVIDRDEGEPVRPALGAGDVPMVAPV